MFSPFAGIGSEGYEAVRLGRCFYGCEIKDEYHIACINNLVRAQSDARAGQLPLFDSSPV